ncbi:MAG TPA: glutamine synthetase, partial [Deltaproteobacteria bacterium]|nr:glutamine synthetase [Deltaproteobacteria bacterium]
PETFAQIPWDKRVGRVYCTCFRNREERENPGGHLTSDCRGNLRIIHEEFQKKYKGLHLRIGTEPEMMWLTRNEDGTPTGKGFSKPFCYHIDQFESLRPVFMTVIEYATAMGLDMIQGDHEDAPGQLELNWTFDDVLRNADRLSTYRQICKQVAREHNLIACFMTKPFMGVSASGCHTNMSLWKGGSEKLNKLGFKKLAGHEGNFTYLSGGENTFMPDTEDRQLPGKIGLQAIGGVMKHLPALTAIGSSTVNSYRRLWDTGFWAPVYAHWGYQNRTCGLRVSAPGRFEYRSVDSMHNPYLMGAALLKAFDDGISNNIDPGKPESRNIYEAQKAGKKGKKLPLSLGEALDHLAQDEVIKSALPDEMYKVFHWYKNDEWEKFLGATTQWDIDTYMDCLP